MGGTSTAAGELQRLKVLNNNVVLARDTGGREVILVGRGLGFGSGPARFRPDDPRVEKLFVLAGVGPNLLELLQSDAALLATCAEIVGLAARRLGRNLSNQVYEALTEHMALALQRTRLGVQVPNPFLAEIQSLYPEEFQVAGEALEMIAERLGEPLPEAERGFLALHLAAGRYGRSAKAMARHVAVVQETLEEVRRRVCPGGAATPKDYENAFSRLAVHLHHGLMAASQRRQVPNPLLHTIRSQYPEAYQMARELADRMASRIGYPISDEQAGYLTVHILRLQACKQERNESP